MQQQQDPLTQIQQREIALKEAEFQHKQQLDIAKLQADMDKSKANVAVQRKELNLKSGVMAQGLVLI